MHTLYSVLDLMLESGERLPCLVDSETWLPARVATRWVMKVRRGRVRRATLADNLRVLARVYTWARQVESFDLDESLVEGKILSVIQVTSLAKYLQITSEPIAENAALACLPSLAVRGTTFNHQLSISKMFLSWALDPLNCGGEFELAVTRLDAERERLAGLLDSFALGVRSAMRIEPLTDDEVATIRRAIGPFCQPDGSWLRNKHGSLVFPPEVFTASTCLRNWLMFEICLTLGLRRGELLKLHLDSLPNGRDDYITVTRHADDPLDSRTREPAVKTAERVLPAPRPLLIALREYLTSRTTARRTYGKSAYLFVGADGKPLSLARADDIIQTIGKYSGIALSWHRLRHTWAEQLARDLAEHPKGQDVLQYLGGWTHPGSSARYTAYATRALAHELLRKRNQNLYSFGGDKSEPK